MSTQPKDFITPEEYLEREAHAERRSEYFNGETFLMAGASLRHVRIVSDIVIYLGAKLKQKRRCDIYSVDLRLRVSATGLYTYPDVMAICGAPAFVERRTDTITNPTLIIEVLSDSTKDYDRGEKFEHYRTLDSLAEYVLVAQDKIHVEQFTRRVEGGWLLTETNRRAGTLSLTSIGCELSLTEIYDGIDDLPPTAG